MVVNYTHFITESHQLRTLCECISIYHYTYIDNVDIETHNIASHIDPPIFFQHPFMQVSPQLLQKTSKYEQHFFTPRTCPRKVMKTSQQTQLKRRFASNTTSSFERAARVMVVNSSKAHKHTRILKTLESNRARRESRISAGGWGSQVNLATGQSVQSRRHFDQSSQVSLCRSPSSQALKRSLQSWSYSCSNLLGTAQFVQTWAQSFTIPQMLRNSNSGILSQRTSHWKAGHTQFHFQNCNARRQTSNP